MTRAYIIVLVAACATWGATSCTRQHVCGDGEATGPEECDTNDMRGRTCAELTDHGGAECPLYCSDTCTYITQACVCGDSGCGNGVAELGESCDCGTQATNLPRHCTDINGGPNANCDSYCQRLAYCGDGIATSDEHCDCGAEPDLLSNNCTDLNGAGGSTCTATCLWTHETCDAPLGQPCDPARPTACCPDLWTTPTTCATALEAPEPHCARECDTTADCYYSYECRTAAGICTPSLCGQGQPYEQLHDPCAVEGGGPGWCTPVVDRTQPDATPMGVCVESGALAMGTECYTRPGLLGHDRSAEVCDAGLCIGAYGAPWLGTCRRFCDWESEYDAIFYAGLGSLRCPDHSSCVSFARLHPLTGIRGPDLSYCLPDDDLDLPHATTACSLLTGQKLSDPTQRCGDTDPPQRCIMVPLTDGTPANGTMLGVCGEHPPPTHLVWDLCNPVVDVCPEGSVCEREDYFDALPAGPRRCLPLCDTQHHTTPIHCTALRAGAPLAYCRSLSAKAAPTDVSPTRLGLCALP